MRRGGGGSRAVLRDEATAGRGAAATESACRRVRGERAWREAGCERGEARTKGRESGGRSGGAGRTTDERREEAAGGQGVSLRCACEQSGLFVSRPHLVLWCEGGRRSSWPTDDDTPTVARSRRRSLLPPDRLRLSAALSSDSGLPRRIRLALDCARAFRPFPPLPLSVGPLTRLLATLSGTTPS